MSLSVNFNEALTLIQTIGASNTVLLRGAPGTGKSSLLKTLSKSMPDYKACYIDVANLDLGDIAMPMVNRERRVTEYAPNARFGVETGSEQPVLLMLDELGKASRPVLNMLLPVILEHRLGDVELPVGSIVFATTNLDTDGVGDSIPAHAYNRMTVVDYANPTCEEWLAWAATAGVAPEIMAFAKQVPQVFDRYDMIDKDTKNPHIFNPRTGNVKAYCSPRSLAGASNIVRNRHVLGPKATLAALAGTIGEAAARDMEALISLADTLPTFDDIVNAPATTKIPESPGALFILAFMLAGRAEKDTMPAVMEYAKRMEDVSFEAHALFISTVAGNATKVGMACANREFTKACASLGKLIS